MIPVTFQQHGWNAGESAVRFGFAPNPELGLALRDKDVFTGRQSRKTVGPIGTFLFMLVTMIAPSALNAQSRSDGAPREPQRIEFVQRMPSIEDVNKRAADDDGRDVPNLKMRAQSFINSMGGQGSSSVNVTVDVGDMLEAIDNHNASVAMHALPAVYYVAHQPTAEYQHQLETDPQELASDDTTGARSDGAERTVSIAGTGFNVRTDGLIVTNYHLVRGMIEQPDIHELKLYDFRGKPYTGRVVAYDVKADLALVDIDSGGDKLPTLRFVENSGQVPLGSNINLMGHPGGNLNYSWNHGQVSGVNRNLQDLSRTGDREMSSVVVPLIQHDAGSFNGFSGGPLLDSDGRVVAVHVGHYGNTGDLGLAIPANEAARMIWLYDNGYSQARGVQIGVPTIGIYEFNDRLKLLTLQHQRVLEGEQPESAAQVKHIMDRMGSALESSRFNELSERDNVEGGILIYLDDSNRERAEANGLQHGDLIIAIDGRETAYWNSSQFHRYLQQQHQAVPVELTILRDGRRRNVTVRHLVEGS